jgi:hypothetical protein
MRLEHIIESAIGSAPNRLNGEALGADILERGGGYAYRIDGQRVNCHGPDLDPRPVARIEVAPG